MLIKICTVIFYIMLALYFFHIGFPYQMPLIGISALILGIVSAL